jgi:Tfp pilus tip-associated adhesin PilY1
VIDMKRVRPPQTLIACIAAALVAGAAGSAAAQVATDDTALFSTVVAPNVLLVVDNSGSMNHVVWHPAYDPSVDPTTGAGACAFFDNDTQYFVNSYSGDTNGPSSSTDTTFAPGTFTVCGRTREIFIDPVVQADGNSTRWMGSYLNWYFGPNSDPYISEITASSNGTRSACLVGEGFGSTYPKYRRTRISAVQEILHDVVCQVNAAGAVRFGMAKFYDDTDPQGGYVRVPIDDYTSAQGSSLRNAFNALEGEAWTPLGETLFKVYSYFMSRGSNRPVGKDGSTKFSVYNLNTSGNTTSSYLPDIMFDSSSGEYLPCRKNFVVILTDGEPTKDDFDSMNLSTFRDNLIGDFAPDTGADSYPEDVNGTHNEDSGGTGGHDDDICSDCETALYVDDIAAFMATTDVRPDIDGDQFIDTYTVGFTTSPYADAVLKKTAALGNGLFFRSDNAEELAVAITKAISDIVTKSQVFTAATIPASRTSASNALYASYFVPRRDAFWAGHLKQFDFTADGEVRDASDPSKCVLDDPDSTDPLTGPCAKGDLLLESLAFWDAAEEIPTSSARNLYTSVDEPARSVGVAIAKPTELTAGNLEAADILSSSFVQGETGFSGDLESLSGSALDNLIDDLADSYADVGSGAAGVDDDVEFVQLIVDYTRGCDFGSSPCTERATKLADIFHSNPVVVGAPNSSINYASYKSFAATYKHRDKVIYAGSNGGLVHGFHTGSWQPEDPGPPVVPAGYDRGTGEELMGFAAYPARENLGELPLQPNGKVYYMDGSPQAADVWLYPNATAFPADAADWHTVLAGGMRQGGRVLWALDVTNPEEAISGGPEYPGYLWEFPCEDSSCDSERQWMGETWSDPVFARVRVSVNGDLGPTGKGYDRWVLIFGAGYDACNDPHSLEYADASTCPGGTRAGRAIYMVDVTTGRVLAAKRWNSASSGPESEMNWAFASSPAVFDTDFNGYADVILIGDLGGNLFKWVVDDVIEDPINGSGTTDPAEWDFVRLFTAGTCEPPDCTTTRRKSFFFPPTGAMLHGELLIAFGSGERNQLQYLGEPPPVDAENNRFYVMKDSDPLEKGATTPAGPTARYTDVGTDFVDVTTLNPSDCAFPAPPAVGYYYQADDAEKFVTNSVIFLGVVLTGSYLHEVPTTPCETGGKAFLYGFSVLCGAPALPNPSGDPDDPAVSRIEIGTGLPTKTKVSVGPLTDQEEGGDCPNKALALSSSGSVYGFDASCVPNHGVRVKSWRDE